MSDAVERAKAFLRDIGHGGGSPAGLGYSAGNSGLALTTTRPAQPPAPLVQKLRLRMACSKAGGHFIGLAEAGGSTLRLVGAELIRPSGFGDSSSTVPFLGTYRNFNVARGVTCPICGTVISDVPSSIVGWLCGCGKFDGWIHCGGLTNSWGYCACGQFSVIEPQRVNEFPAQAEYSSRKVNVPSPAHETRAPQHSYAAGSALPPPSSTLRLGYRR